MTLGLGFLRYLKIAVAHSPNALSRDHKIPRNENQFPVPIFRKFSCGAKVPFVVARKRKVHSSGRVSPLS